MKLIIIIISSFVLITTVQSSLNNDNGKFDYFMFENFPQNEENFKQELKLVNVLKDYSHKLKTWRATIKIHLEQFKSRIAIGNHLPISFFHILSRVFAYQTTIKNMKDILNSLKTPIANFTEKFPIYTDLVGAIKAMVHLVNTYKLDLVSMAKDSPAITTNDLYNMAGTAMNLKYYDTSVDILKAAYDIAPFKPIESNETKTLLDDLKKQVLRIHNSLVTKRKKRVSETHKVHPYIVKENLQRKEKQPKEFKKIKWFERDEFDPEENMRGMVREEALSRICNKVLRGNWTDHYKCHFLHHFDPFLKLGPFKLEIKLDLPYRAVLHDILNDEEIQHMIDLSKPHLSRERVADRNNIGDAHQFRYGGKKIIIHKTVQHWFEDVKYNDSLVKYYLSDSKGPHSKVTFDDVSLAVLDGYDKYTVEDSVMFKITKRFELATQMVIQNVFSSSRYQTTNYGLGGLCESHIDPSGEVMNKIEMSPDKNYIKAKGDMIATLMAWLNTPKAGGGTGFIYQNREMLLEPTKGSAGFWMGTKSSMHLEPESIHGGCPVLQGNKWILNKWIYGFDQWKKYPCSLKKEEKILGFSGITR